MSLEADLVTTLGPVFSARFYPSVAPAGTVPPYALYDLTSRVDETAMDGATPNLSNARVSITMFGRDKFVLVGLVADTKAAMLAATLFKSVCANEQDLWEDPSVLFGKLVDFSVWHYYS